MEMKIDENAKRILTRQQHLLDVVSELRKNIFAIGVRVKALDFILEVKDTFYFLIQHEEAYLVEVINQGIQFEVAYNKEWIVPPADVATEIEKRLAEITEQ